MWKDDGDELGVPCRIGLLLELLLTGKYYALCLLFVDLTICIVLFVIYRSALKRKWDDKVYSDETG